MIEEEIADRIHAVLSEDSPRYTDIPQIISEYPEYDSEMLDDIINNDWDEDSVQKWYHALDFLGEWGDLLSDLVADFDGEEEDE